MILIDTNVYSALDKGASVAVDALRGQSNVYLPIVVIGELRYGFANGGKQKENESRLTKFLAQDMVDVIYPTLKTTELYSQLALRCKQTGRALSHNDLWIAAMANEVGAIFVTYDNDFAVFADIFGDKLIILVD